MRAIVLAALLMAAAGVSGDELKVFTDPARPVRETVRESFLYGVKERHPKAAAVLLIDMHAEYQGVSLSFPTGYVLMKPRQSSPGVCRGTLKTYRFDTVSMKWETVEDPEGLMSYFFPPAAKTKCSSIESRPTLLLGKITDADILGVVDGLRMARIAKEHASEGLAARLPHDETIEAISGGTRSRDVYTAKRVVTLEKHDGVWWIVGVVDAPK